MLARELDLAEPVAVALVRRGFRTVEAARAFLAADESHDPSEFDGIGDAVAAIRGAIERNERITVHGDYDVDGVTATTILVSALREAGADCDWLIPARVEDGYGVTMATVDRLAERGTGSVKPHAQQQRECEEEWNRRGNRRPLDSKFWRQDER